MTRRSFLALLFGSVGGAAAWNLRAFRPEAVPSVIPSATPTTTTTQVPAATTTTTREIVRLEIIGREAWGAAESGTFKSHTIERITFHHTASVLTDNTRAPFRMRDHQAFHQQQGWPDLAYHFIIDRNGNVYEGRPVGASGDTFTDYDPTGHFLPVLDGDFNQQEPTDAQLASLATLMAWAIDEFDLTPTTIGAHRDYAATSCPGDALYGRKAELLGRMTALREGGAVEMVTLTGDVAAARVADIEAGLL